MVIDTHTHIFPEKVAEKAVGVLAARSNLCPSTNGTASSLKANMDKAGIDLSINLPVVTTPKQFRSITEFAMQINRDYEGSILSFGGVHPQSSTWKEEIDELAALGFKGIKLHPDYQETYIDDLENIRLINRAAEHNMIIVLHSGIDAGLPPPVHCTPKRGAVLLKELQGYERIVFAHCGASGQEEETLQYLAGSPCYFDLSFDLLKQPRDTVMKIIRAQTPERCLFATDSPWSDPVESLKVLRSLPLTAAEIAQIESGNALRLLNA